eukprot:XP_001697788.1 predicted protein [Chlamydomonas reinhardtii]
MDRVGAGGREIGHSRGEVQEDKRESAWTQCAVVKRLLRSALSCEGQKTDCGSTELEPELSVFTHGVRGDCVVRGSQIGWHGCRGSPAACTVRGRMQQWTAF